MKTIGKSLLVVIALFLSGCFGTTIHRYDYDVLSTQVVSIEIVEVSVLNDLTIDLSTLITINENDIEDLLNALSKINFQVIKNPPSRPYGNALKLNYTSGYDIIANNVILTFDEEGVETNHLFIITPDELITLVERYIDTTP